jgi:ketosteroid isomerase-like protein
MTNLEIVQRMYTAVREQDRDTIVALFAPDIEWIQNEGFPGGGRHVGVEAVIAGVFTKLRREWEGWRAPVAEWIDAGDTIIALGEYHGTNKSTGKSMRAAFAHVYRVEAGRIRRFQQFTDTHMVAQATR